MNTVQTHIPIMEDDIPRDGGMWPEYAATMLIYVSAIKMGEFAANCGFSITNGPVYSAVWTNSCL